MFRESIKEGDMTNMGKVLWMDAPYTDKDGKPADILVKTDKPSKAQSFTWARLSELQKIEEPKKEEPKMETTVKDTKPEIEFGDLMKVDIRVCKVKTADKVKGKDRLLLLTIDTGQDERVVVTNLGGTYKPEDLAGKCFSFVLNLKPARIAGIESFGMIMAAGDGAKPYLIEVNAPVGSKLL